MKFPSLTNLSNRLLHYNWWPRHELNCLNGYNLKQPVSKPTHERLFCTCKENFNRRKWTFIIDTCTFQSTKPLSGLTVITKNLNAVNKHLINLSKLLADIPKVNLTNKRYAWNRFALGTAHNSEPEKLFICWITYTYKSFKMLCRLTEATHDIFSQS